MVPGAVHPAQLARLFRGELRLFSSQLALGPGDCHAFAGAQPDQVALELGEGRQMLKNIFPMGSAGS